jgi:uncharacterized Zn finger protein
MSIPNHTLARVDTERLQRGVEGLASGAYRITMTRQNEDEISAFVANGDGVDYSVTLTAMRSFCSCRDSMFRAKCCKHAVAVALHAIRNPPMATGASDLSLAKVRRHEESAPF